MANPDLTRQFLQRLVPHIFTQRRRTTPIETRSRRKETTSAQAEPSLAGLSSVQAQAAPSSPEQAEPSPPSTSDELNLFHSPFSDEPAQLWQRMTAVIASSEQRMTAAITSSEQRITAAIASSEQRMTAAMASSEERMTATIAAQLDRLEAILLLARASDSTSSAGRRLTASSAMGVTRPTAGPASAGGRLTVPSAMGSSSVTGPTAGSSSAGSRLNVPFAVGSSSVTGPTAGSRRSKRERSPSEPEAQPAKKKGKRKKKD